MAAPGSEMETLFGHLRGQTLWALVWGLLAAALGVLWLLAVQPGRWTLEPMWVAAALAATAWAGRAWAPNRPALAGTALLVGSAATITTAVLAFGMGLLAALYPLIVPATAVLFGWPKAAVSAAGLTVLVGAITNERPDLLPLDVATIVVVLIGANLAVAWILAQPLRTALEWSWSSYEQARQKTEEARVRQAELASLSRRLADANHQLEITNAELDRARRAAVRARTLKAEFAAAISHELRTPLNLIIGFSDLLVLSRRKSGPSALPEAFHGDVEAIHRNACHLSGLIDDVLELAQVEAHRMGMKKEVGQLRPIVLEAFDAVEMLLRDRGLAAAVEVPEDLPPVNVDRTRIRQVLINLLINAARFTFRGSITVRAEARENDVVVEVADTGVGIPPDDLASIFEEFHQASGSDRLHHSGLGLTISKQIVELHGGSMWAESTVGEGSRFFLSLPVCDNVVALSQDEWETWARPVAAEDPAVLVLGRDRDGVRLVERFLDGYRVVAANSPLRAARLARSRPFRALLALDAFGREEAARLQSRQPSLRALPLVSCHLRTVGAVGHELGVSAYLTKPVTREQLRTALHSRKGSVRDVLVVDDDPDVVHLLTRTLASLSSDYQVRGAAGGAAALEALRQRPPDLVLLDLLMPDLDGYAVLEAMRSEPRLASVPVIVVSARGTEEHTVTADRIEISRPGGLSVAELMETLRATLDRLAVVDEPAPAQPADSVA